MSGVAAKARAMESIQLMKVAEVFKSTNLEIRNNVNTTIVTKLWFSFC